MLLQTEKTATFESLASSGFDTNTSGATKDMDSQSDERGSIESHRELKRPGWWEIGVSSCWLTLPLAILTVALITYVFKHQVKSPNDVSLVLNQNSPSVPNDRAIYVQVDSTMLVFLASWMSSVAPLLTGFAIALATFPMTQQILSDTKASDRADDLPTSFQLYLMLKLINGSTWTGLWGLLDYRLKWKQRAEGRSIALNSLISVTLGTVILSAVIFAADTWLHMATTTVNLIIPYPLPAQEALYSLSSLPSCTRSNNSWAALQDTNTSCTLNPAFDLPVFVDPVSTVLTLNGRSQSISVLQTSNGELTYLGVPRTAQNASHDFRASTFAARAACSSTSQACNLVNHHNVTFNCDNGAFAIEGDQLAEQGFAVQVFKYSNLSDFEDGLQEYGVPNPFYVAGATVNLLPPNSTLRTDPGVVTTGSTVSAVFQCQITILDIEYTSAHGVVSIVSETASNSSTTNMFVSAFTGMSFGQDVIEVNLELAAVVADSAQDFANRFGAELNNAILSSGAGSVMRVPVEAAQVREEVMVARIPKAPFYLLIASNVAFVLLGFFLTVAATTTPAEARQAQYQLTTAGLVANLFDRSNARNRVDAVEQLFNEYHEPTSAAKIGIDRTSKGGFELTPLYFAQ